MKQRAIKHRTDSSFFSADAKCRVSVGEPDFPLPSVSRGKKVVVGVNESFRVDDHDFSKVSLIPDAIFVQDISKPQDDKSTDEYLHDDKKSMVLWASLLWGEEYGDTS